MTITTIIPKLPFINKQETIGFYETCLGFTMINDYGDYILMNRHTVELHFFAYPKLNPAQSDFMIYVRVDRDIETFYNNLVNQNLQQLRPLETKPWRQKEFSVVDPNGTLLTFGQAI